MLLNHPRIAVSYEVGESTGRHFQLMRYFGASSLSSHLQSAGRLPVELAVRVTASVACARRDSRGWLRAPPVTPEHVLVDTDGHPTLTGLGFAWEEGHKCDFFSLPERSSWAIAPEIKQFPSQATPQTDVYSLGALLARLVLGAEPPKRRTMTGSCKSKRLSKIGRGGISPPPFRHSFGPRWRPRRSIDPPAHGSSLPTPAPSGARGIRRLGGQFARGLLRRRRLRRSAMVRSAIATGRQADLQGLSRDGDQNAAARTFAGDRPSVSRIVGSLSSPGEKPRLRSRRSVFRSQFNRVARR